MFKAPMSDEEMELVCCLSTLDDVDTIVEDLLMFNFEHLESVEYDVLLLEWGFRPSVATLGVLTTNASMENL